jgi:moderate conductance mechanosensitive channel
VPKWLEVLQKSLPTVEPYIILKGIFNVLLTIVVARLLFWLLNGTLRKVFIKKTGSTFLLEERRAKTLYPMIRSILFYGISFFALMNILALLNIPTATLLASASVLGLAVGFGAQSLVKDVISGFFIIFEDQFAVGEYVKTDKYAGVVEEIGLRATKLRDWGGELHILPNGTVTSITNYNRGRMRALVDISLPYDEDIEVAMEIISQTTQTLAEQLRDKIIEGPNVQGIINLGESHVVVRVVAFTQPMEQWAVERELRRVILLALADAGIRLPNIKKTPNQTQAKEGN